MEIKDFSRKLESCLRARASQFPVVTVTGPRQSGKTTLCRRTFPDKPYVNLERPDTREYARTDPRGLLDGLPDGAILDEIQRVPELLSWIQAIVDEKREPGQFILTGSHQFSLNREISQTLAGRTALLRLLPLAIDELADAGVLADLDTTLWQGGYPRIHSHRLSPPTVLGDYFDTYVQRDLRDLMEIRRIDQFERFVRLAAGRIGQPLNLSALGADAGVSAPTAREWLTLLEASYVVFCLPPWFANIGKRLVKAPKLYFCDTGLAAWLLNIRDREHLVSHPLRGNLFENLVVLEILKHFHNKGERAPLYFYRDSGGSEVDLLIEEGASLRLAEIKSGQTVSADFLRPMEKLATRLGGRVKDAALIHGGAESQSRRIGEIDCRVMSWRGAGAWVG